MLSSIENEVREFLISVAKEKRVVPYSELAQKFNLDIKDKHQAWIGTIEEWMIKINDYELENKRPMLSAIIVLKKNPHDINSMWGCGQGFYGYAREHGLLEKGQDPQVFHAKELGKIFEYWDKNDK